MKNSDVDPIFDPNALVSQNKDLTTKLNALHDLNERFRAENAKVKQHNKELYDSIKITRAKTIDQKNSLLTKIENLKTQLKGKMPCVTIDVKTPNVYAFEKYAIDVEPIPPCQRSNRNVHHGYLNSLKDTLDTLCEIVEEARSELPSDNKFIATTPVTKKKRVTFADPLETSGNNTPKHVKQQSVQPTNVPILPSTGVNTATIASGSKPRSNTKKDKTLPAKNSHDKCVDKSLKFSKPTPVRKIWRVKQVKQTWQPTGKLFTTVGHHWKPTGRTFPLGAQCPLTRKTTPKVVPVKIWKPTGRIIPLRGQCPLTRPTALTSDVVLADPQAHHAPVDYNIVCSNQLDPNIDWGSNTQLNLTKPRWEATGLEFMHDYKILNSPRAVLLRDKYGMQMLMRFNEIHKFSDGTLQQIDEALDYRVKEFKVNKINPGLNTRFWTTNDVIKSKQFMFAIQKRLKLRRIFRNLESFIGGRRRRRLQTSTVKGLHNSSTVASSTSCVDGKVRYEFPRSRQSQRDLPKDNLLVSVEVLRYDYKRSNVNKGIVRTEMELVLEHTQQGTSNEVSVSTKGVKE
ncbi:hypothetical protein Tco_1407592 [Tanacetum coccineum]